MPEMGESVTEGTVLEWHKQEGDSFSEGDTLVEVSTDKVDAEVPAPGDGTLSKILKQPDETVKVGEALAELEIGAGEPGDAGSDPENQTETEASDEPSRGSDPTGDDGAAGDGRASPVARRIAADKGVDLGRIEGTGVNGKITKEDVLAAADGKGDGAAPAEGPPAEGKASPLRGPAAMLAKAMNESRSMPTATSFRTLPVDVLDAKRKALNGVLNERGLKVSFTHLIAWAIVRAAAEDHPAMARTYAEQDGKLQIVDARPGQPRDRGRHRAQGRAQPDGPLHQGRRLARLQGFHSYYEDLITKTRENKLTADDFQGTNITLTNPGGLGTVASVPRLLTGQGTIVATGSIAYPVEWAHAQPEKISLARDLEGDDDDVHLRPPDHPGRGVGRRSCAGSTSSCWERTPSTSRSPRTSRSARASSPRPSPPRPRRTPVAFVRDHRARRREAERRAATGGAGRHLDTQGVPHPRPPRRAGSTRSARSRRAIRRSSPRTST